MTDTRDLVARIEALRQELYKEFEKNIDNKRIDTKIIEISQRLDTLIVNYLKEMSDRHKK